MSKLLETSVPTARSWAARNFHSRPKHPCSHLVAVRFTSTTSQLRLDRLSCSGSSANSPCRSLHYCSRSVALNSLIFFFNSRLTAHIFSKGLLPRDLILVLLQTLRSVYIHITATLFHRIRYPRHCWYAHDFLYGLERVAVVLDLSRRTHAPICFRRQTHDTVVTCIALLAPPAPPRAILTTLQTSSITFRSLTCR